MTMSVVSTTDFRTTHEPLCDHGLPDLSGPRAAVVVAIEVFMNRYGNLSDLLEAAQTPATDGSAVPARNPFAALG